MQPSYLVNLANIIHLTEGILVPLTSCYRCQCHHCGRRVWWIHYGYWAKREWLHRLRLQASQPILSSLIRQAHCSYAGCLIGSKRPVYTWSYMELHIATYSYMYIHGAIVY